jgi:hypothetical protein
MTGVAEFNFPAFNEAAEQLRRRGFEVVSPAELDPTTDGEWSAYLRRDLLAMLDCEGIALLPGWALSRGASLEYQIAMALDFELVPLDCPYCGHAAHDLAARCPGWADCDAPAHPGHPCACDATGYNHAAVAELVL